MERFAIASPAKINLGLNVIRRRKDGYHELQMVMQSISIFDEIWIAKSDKPGIRVETDMKQLPTGKRNLAYRAAELFMERFEIEQGVEIMIEKTIPVAAGLAGGSADAAAVLKALNQLFEIRATGKQLRDLGLLIGADVPFCIRRGTALAEGIGERLTRLPAIPECSILLAKPTYGISTKDAFDVFDSLEEPYHPNLSGLIEAVRAKDLNTIAASMGNSLEAAVLPRHADLREMLDLFREQGALGAGMSGSGPSVFAIFRNKDEAEKAERIFRRRFTTCQIMMTEPYQPRRKTG